MAWKPRFSSPRRASAGSRAPVNTMLAMSEECRPSLRAMGRISSPGVPRSTMKSEMPRVALACASVRAATIITSPCSALVA
jgi:hypothetical protein